MRGESTEVESVQRELDKKKNELTLQKRATAAKESEVDNLQQLVRNSEGIGFQKGEKKKKILARRFEASSKPGRYRPGQN